jgi:hypothetical protein
VIRRTLRLVLALAASLLVLLPVEPASAQQPRGRVLVLAMPTLGWADLYQGNTPNLDALVDGSATGALSVRNVVRHTDAADGYAAISAGTRARGVAESGQVLEPTEDFFGVPAGSVFRRNTGNEPGPGLVVLPFPAIVSRNNRLDFDAEVGSVGQALSDAGVPRAVIANAAGRYALGAPTFDRHAGIALADKEGVVPAGTVSDVLIQEDPLAPFGVSYDPAAVLTAFQPAWEQGGVVLVEGSDLARADRYRSLATAAQRERLRTDALRRTDQLVGGLLAEVDPEHDSVLLVGPYHSSAGPHLTVAALRSPEVNGGQLRSASTRRAGYVTLVDIGPTILDLAGVERPDAMEGRRFEAVGEPRAGRDRAVELAEIDAAARYRDSMVAPVATLFVVLQAVLWVAAAVALTKGRRIHRRVVAFAALVMLGYLPGTYLAGLIGFHERSDAAYYAFVFAVALLVAALAAVLGRWRPLDPLIWALGAVFGLLAVDMVLGAPLQINTVFGYSPTVGGRFAGMGNLAYGQFAGAAFLLCGLVSRRLTGRSYATVAALSVLVLAIVIDGAPFWGSDVGGVLAFVPAIGVTASRLLGRRLRWRSLLVWGFGTLVVIGAFAAIDLSRPADKRTHLGRLVESVSDKGWGSFVTVISRKLGANLTVITSSVWTAMVPIVLCFIVYLLWRAPGRMKVIRDTLPESLPGLAVVGFLGFALNDSGIAVPGVLLGVVNASLVHLTVRTLPGADADAALPPPEAVA